MVSICTSCYAARVMPIDLITELFNTLVTDQIRNLRIYKSSALTLAFSCYCGNNTTTVFLLFYRAFPFVGHYIFPKLAGETKCNGQFLLLLVKYRCNNILLTILFKSKKQMQ